MLVIVLVNKLQYCTCCWTCSNKNCRFIGSIKKNMMMSLLRNRRMLNCFGMLISCMFHSILIPKHKKFGYHNTLKRLSLEKKCQYRIYKKDSFSFITISESKDNLQHLWMKQLLSQIKMNLSKSSSKNQLKWSIQIKIQESKWLPKWFSKKTLATIVKSLSYCTI